VTGSCPVAGRPGLFRTTFFVDSFIENVLRLSCLKDKRPANVFEHVDGPNPEQRIRSMPKATNLSTTPSRFHNLSDSALADMLGQADAVLKGAEAECKLLKDEFKRRGLVEVAGDQFTVTATEQIAGRLDSKAVKEYLGESYRRFEVAVISTVIRVKAVQRFAAAA
jgi:hypothetical protein